MKGHKQRMLAKPWIMQTSCLLWNQGAKERTKAQLPGFQMYYVQYSLKESFDSSHTFWLNPLPKPGCTQCREDRRSCPPLRDPPWAPSPVRWLNKAKLGSNPRELEDGYCGQPSFCALSTSQVCEGEEASGTDKKETTPQVTTREYNRRWYNLRLAESLGTPNLITP